MQQPGFDPYRLWQLLRAAGIDPTAAGAPDPNQPPPDGYPPLPPPEERLPQPYAAPGRPEIPMMPPMSPAQEPPPPIPPWDQRLPQQLSMSTGAGAGDGGDQPPPPPPPDGGGGMDVPGVQGISQILGYLFGGGQRIPVTQNGRGGFSGGPDVQPPMGGPMPDRMPGGGMDAGMSNGGSTMIRLPGGDEQVPDSVVQGAQNALQQYGVPPDPQFLAAFLAAARDPKYRDQIPQGVQTGKLPPSMLAAVNSMKGGASMGNGSTAVPGLPPNPYRQLMTDSGGGGY